MGPGILEGLLPRAKRVFANGKIKWQWVFFFSLLFFLVFFLFLLTVATTCVTSTGGPGRLLFPFFYYYLIYLRLFLRNKRKIAHFVIMMTHTHIHTYTCSFVLFSLRGRCCCFLCSLCR
ncbi:hypothetical protein B0T17DRAFT_524676 [Bombardia bombarda]|uniref:Uncharacterized protein n=1 Tax=Bombardia bombarda TaxID=252184 RepID=A0AA40C8P5_9PEZI|nr:hypothetical protein B0T17DRAFT_524676 [Bombardia bombarda]